MHYGRKNTRRPYFIDGSKLESSVRARDLGVIMTPDFSYSEQTREAANKAARMCNFILRSFVVRDVDLYRNLFRIYVEPILTYCAPVWNPRLKRDRKILQAVCDRFRKRVAFKCDVEKEAITKIEIDKMLKLADQRMLVSIRKDQELCDYLSDQTVSITRANGALRPKFRAKNDKVNSLFSWRVSRPFLV